MRNITCLLFFISLSFLHAQEDVFDIARNGTVLQMEAIYKKKPEQITAKNEFGYTPLLLACYNKNAIIVQYLVDKKVDVNGLSKYGTPLMAAVYKRNVAIVDILLKNGADPNKSDARGTTALHYAMLFNNTEIAEKLINAGAKANIADTTGKTAYDYAKSHKNQKIINLIKTKAL